MGLSDLAKNVASAEDEFNSQKAQVQQEAEVGEKAAALAAKLPVSPETAIEGFLLWGRVKQYVVPALGATFALVAAVIAYEAMQRKNHET